MSLMKYSKEREREREKACSEKLNTTKSMAIVLYYSHSVGISSKD